MVVLVPSSVSCADANASQVATPSGENGKRPAIIDAASEPPLKRLQFETDALALEDDIRSIETKTDSSICSAKRVCWFYASGRCRAGAACPYVHKELEPVSKATRLMTSQRPQALQSGKPA